MPVIFQFLIVCAAIMLIGGAIADYRLKKAWEKEDEEQSHAGH